MPCFLMFFLLERGPLDNVPHAIDTYPASAAAKTILSIK